MIQHPQRNKLQSYLKENNVSSAVHYPTPIHLQPSSNKYGYKKGDFPITEKQSNQILTIPIHQYLSNSDVEKVSKLINNFKS